MNPGCDGIYYTEMHTKYLHSKIYFWFMRQTIMGAYNLQQIWEMYIKTNYDAVGTGFSMIHYKVILHKTWNGKWRKYILNSTVKDNSNFSLIGKLLSTVSI